MLLILLALSAVYPTAQGAQVYHLVIGLGDWALYEVVEAGGGARISGVEVEEGDKLRFVLVDTEEGRIEGSGGDLLYVEWPRCDIYLNGELVAENTSTLLLWPFWPTEEGFWDRLTMISKGEEAKLSVEVGTWSVVVRFRGEGMEITWEVDEDKGVCLSYELAAEGGYRIRMVMEETNVPGVGPSPGQEVLGALKPHSPYILAGLVVFFVALVASLWARRRASTWI